MINHLPSIHACMNKFASSTHTCVNAHTSNNTTPKLYTSPAHVAAPPRRRSGAAHAVVPARSEPASDAPEFCREGDHTRTT